MQVAGGRRSAVAKREARAAQPTNVPPAPKTLEDAAKVSAWAIRAVGTGEIDPKVSREIQYGVAQFRGALEKRDLLRQIEQLRKELAAAQAKPGPRAVA